MVCSRKEDKLKKALTKFESFFVADNVSGENCNFEDVFFVNQTAEFSGRIDTLVNTTEYWPLHQLEVLHTILKSKK